MQTKRSQLRGVAVWTALGVWSIGSLALPPARAAGQEFRRLPVKEYRDKMKAGWIGQIIGVSWGAPTEGRYKQIMPAENMPPFTEDLVNMPSARMTCTSR